VNPVIKLIDFSFTLGVFYTSNYSKGGLNEYCLYNTENRKPQNAYANISVCNQLLSYTHSRAPLEWGDLFPLSNIWLGHNFSKSLVSVINNPVIKLIDFSFTLGVFYTSNYSKGGLNEYCLAMLLLKVELSTAVPLGFENTSI
jgi:hypothetical protein